MEPIYHDWRNLCFLQRDEFQFGRKWVFRIRAEQVGAGNANRSLIVAVATLVSTAALTFPELSNFGLATVVVVAAEFATAVATPT